MSEVRIAAESRTEFGKGAARRVRRADKVPAVLYGHGTDTRHISLPGHELMLALKGGANTLLRLTGLEGGDALALPRAVQRDPVKGFLEHIDLLLVRRGEKVTVDVRVVPLGEVVSGGLLDVQSTTLSVEAEATHIPAQFEVAIDGLEIGGAVHAKEIELPSGVNLLTDPDAVILHVLPSPTAEQMEAEISTAEAELGAGAASGAAQRAAEGEVAGGTTGMGDAAPAEHGAGTPAQEQTPRGE
ncbi:MAG: 50S ribosomal protein L25/general stress protein Ctc [Frankiaceae bacterium]